MRNACDVFVHAVVSDFFMQDVGVAHSPSDDDGGSGGDGSARDADLHDQLAPPHPSSFDAPINPPTPPTPPTAHPSTSGVPLTSLPDVLLPEALLSLCLSHLCGHLETFGVVKARPIVGAKFVKEIVMKGVDVDDETEIDSSAHALSHEELTKTLKDTKGAKAMREERERNRRDIAAFADDEDLGDVFTSFAAVH